MENERPLFKRKKDCDKYFSCCMSLVPSVCLSPDWALKKLNEALWSFLWGSKKDPVKRAVVRLPFELGGLQIVDLEKKSQDIKMTWIAKLFDENCPGKFKHTMIEILNQYKEANFGKNVFKLFLSSYYIRQLPQFYSKLLITWVIFRKTDGVNLIL